MLQQQLARSRYIRLLALLAVVIVVCSFYIYQRVWVRDLLDEVKTLEDQNEMLLRETADLESSWARASSLRSIENLIADRQLGLTPAEPSQYLALVPLQEVPGRFDGFRAALRKLRDNLPIVSSSRAEAFEGTDSSR
jgi:cell division protein FtsL